MCTNVASNTSKIANIAENMHIDTTSVDNQEVITEVYEWYCKRIDMCIEDDCKEAVSAYLHKLLKDERANDITRSYVIVYANKGGKRNV